MSPRSRRQSRRRLTIEDSRFAVTFLLACQFSHAAAIVYPSNHELYKFDYLSNNNTWYRGIERAVSKINNSVPLIVTNNCPDTIWPAIATQHGDGPESQGFALASKETRPMTVGPTWQGRLWGRTNCTTDGDTATCETGDCSHKLECEFAGAVPVTLAEFNLAGGTTGKQTFYDLSLVDGYNLPIGIIYHPAPNTSYIPPNLVNPSCIGTTGYLYSPNRTGLYHTNSSYPIPYENRETNSDIADWCPWDLQAFPPTKPGDGVYPYPDDNIQRPIFDPCKSACAAYNQPQDCCTGDYNDPTKCGPGLYSKTAKAMCPDAYSYAFDDQTSTFIIPNGGGWEVMFCPPGRSTNIQLTFHDELAAIGSSGQVSDEARLHTMSLSYIESKQSIAPYTGLPVQLLALSVGVTAVSMLCWF